MAQEKRTAEPQDALELCRQRKTAAEIFKLLECVIWDLQNRRTSEDVKYGRDHDGALTLGDLVRKLLAARVGGKEAFLDALDEEFLFGCWGPIFRESLRPAESLYLLKDLRGLCLGLADAEPVKVTKE